MQRNIAKYKKEQKKKASSPHQLTELEKFDLKAQQFNTYFPIPKASKTQQQILDEKRVLLGLQKKPLNRPSTRIQRHDIACRDLISKLKDIETNVDEETYEDDDQDDIVNSVVTNVLKNNRRRIDLSSNDDSLTEDREDDFEDNAYLDEE